MQVKVQLGKSAGQVYIPSPCSTCQGAGQGTFMFLHAAHAKGAVRLVGGCTSCGGHVEIFQDNQWPWGTVCRLL